jgi:hypothetical protein
MATVNSAITPWFATSQLTSPEARWSLAAAFAQDQTSGINPEGGVLPGGGNVNGAFVPTSNGTAANPSVSVAPGQCVINRPVGGVYICTWNAAQTVALDLSLPASGQTRIDLLVAEVVDPEADSGSTSGTVFRVRTVAGVASASPSAPSVPSGTIPLWQWTVSNAGAITNITSRRQWTRAPGGVRLVEPNDTRNGSYPGDLRIFATGQIDAWLNNGSGWGWLTIVAPAVWTQVSIPWTYAGGGGTPAGTANFGVGGTNLCRYKRVGNDLTVSYEAKYGTGNPNMGTGNVSTLLPNGWTTPAGRDQWIPAHLWVNDPVSGYVGDFAGMALVGGGGGGSGGVLPFFPQNINTTKIIGHRVAGTAGVPGGSIPLIGGGYAQGGLIHAFGTVEIAS